MLRALSSIGVLLQVDKDAFTPTRTSIVDVGEGEGEFPRSILELHPTMTGVVFDLPNQLRLPTRTANRAERCSYMAGNFFESVPENAEA